MPEETSLRAFLALDLPPEIRKEIGIIQGRLKKILQGDIRWTNPKGMHLTLKFFGSIFPGQVAAICGTVEPIVAQAMPLALEVKTLGAFPGTKRPRVIWLGIQGDVEPLVGLQREIDRKLFDCGFGAEERPFRPHLTLGRVRPSGKVAGLEDVAARENDYASGSFTAGGLGLWKSDLTPRGAIYTELARFPFARVSSGG
jgi:2'-5' RNA ligase